MNDMNGLFDRESYPKEIDECFVVVSIDKDGFEVFESFLGERMICFALSDKIMQILKKYIAFQKQQGKEMRLLHFTNREEIPL